nr:PH domain leucine-rich repeat-containing protein phosphatase 1-like isoform X2 [Equus caballus]
MRWREPKLCRHLQRSALAVNQRPAGLGSGGSCGFGPLSQIATGSTHRQVFPRRFQGPDPDRGAGDARGTEVQALPAARWAGNSQRAQEAPGGGGTCARPRLAPRAPDGAPGPAPGLRLPLPPSPRRGRAPVGRLYGESGRSVQRRRLRWPLPWALVAVHGCPLPVLPHGGAEHERFHTRLRAGAQASAPASARACASAGVRTGVTASF